MGERGDYNLEDGADSQSGGNDALSPLLSLLIGSLDDKEEEEEEEEEGARAYSKSGQPAQRFLPFQKHTGHLFSVFHHSFIQFRFGWG